MVGHAVAYMWVAKTYGQGAETMSVKFTLDGDDARRKDVLRKIATDFWVQRHVIEEGNAIIAVPHYADCVQDILNQFDVKYTREGRLRQAQYELSGKPACTRRHEIATRKRTMRVVWGCPCTPGRFDWRRRY